MQTKNGGLTAAPVRTIATDTIYSKLYGSARFAHSLAG